VLTALLCIGASEVLGLMILALCQRRRPVSTGHDPGAQWFSFARDAAITNGATDCFELTASELRTYLCDCLSRWRPVDGLRRVSVRKAHDLRRFAAQERGQGRYARNLHDLCRDRQIRHVHQ